MKVIQSTKYWQFAVTISSVGLVLLLAAVLVPVYNVEMTAEAAIGDVTESILTFNSINSVASVSLNVSSKDGTFATSTDAEKARFTVSTNNYTGYTLRIKSSSGNDYLLKNIDDITKSFGSIEASTSSSNFQINKWGYIPSSYRSNNANVTNSSQYFPAPDVDGDVLAVTSSPNSANGINNADEYTIGLGLKADYTNPSGAYANDAFVIESVANAIVYNIGFGNDTGDSTVDYLPSAISGTVDGESVTITNNSTPTRTGYTFAGKWCLGNTTSNGTVCNGTEYSVGDSFGIDKTEDNTNIVLYAMWNPDLTINFTANSGVASVKVCEVSGDCSGDDIKGIVSESGGMVTTLEYGSTYYLYPTFDSGYEFDSWSNVSRYGVVDYGSNDANPSFTVGGGRSKLKITGREPVVCNPNGTTIDDIVCMQDINSSNKESVLNSMEVGASYVLYDSRDKTAYKVAKLADGNIWMRNNLALNLDDVNVQSTMYDSTYPDHDTSTNASNETLGYLFNGGGLTSDKYPTAKINNEAWVSAEQNFYSVPMMVASGTCNNANCVNDSLEWSYNDAVTNDGSPAKDKVGMYYNFCAASAGSYCYGDGTSAVNPNVGSTSEDICPKGWHMPKSGTGNESYNYLGAQYGGTEGVNSTSYSIANALAATLSGLFSSGKASYQQQYGAFLTRNNDANSDFVRFLVIGTGSSGTALTQGTTWLPHSRADAYSIRCMLSGNS